jgi:hypothetical protein
MNGVIDLGALKAQQDIEREAVACGMADHHPIVVGMAPGADGVAIQMVLVGTCAKCKSMVRSEWWRKHKEYHDTYHGPDHAAVELLDQIKDDGAVEEATLLEKLGND